MSPFVNLVITNCSSSSMCGCSEDMKYFKIETSAMCTSDKLMVKLKLRLVCVLATKDLFFFENRQYLVMRQYASD